MDLDKTEIESKNKEENNSIDVINDSESKSKLLPNQTQNKHSNGNTLDKYFPSLINKKRTRPESHDNSNAENQEEVKKTAKEGSSKHYYLTYLGTESSNSKDCENDERKPNSKII